MIRHALVLGGAVAIVCTGQFACSGRTEAADKPVDFQREVRPILANSCFTCHGPDKSHREAELRLDVRDVAVKKAIRPGKGGQSELLKRITSQDPDERMPPSDSGRAALTPAQVETIRRWIDQGAVYSEHWAYAPPVRPAVPTVTGSPWAFNDVDRFVLLSLQQKGLKPSAEADRRTLVRRLSFDLTGVPPTPEEVDAFLADKAPNAYEKLVDRLLASPRYGERMAMFWLDLVRYADTCGYHGDQEQSHWLYRDYVIRAFNSNLPFNQFTTEQLAGDLLPNPTYWQRVASGYNRLGMTTEEGGAQPKEYMAKYAADRVRNVSSVWLGSTMGCSECHDHKFDPFLTRDFYRMEAFFADVEEAAVGSERPTNMLSDEQQKQVNALDAQLVQLARDNLVIARNLAKEQAAWEKQAAPQAPKWQVLKPVEAVADGDTTILNIQDDGSILVTGKNPDTLTYTIDLETTIADLGELQIAALGDPSLPAGGPGRGPDGQFAISTIVVKHTDGAAIRLRSARADFARDKAPARAAIDRDDKTAWDNLHEAGKNHVLEFALEPVAAKPGKPTKLTISISQLAGDGKLLGKFKISGAPAQSSGEPGQPNSVKPIPQEIIDILRTAPAQRTRQQLVQVKAYYITIAPALAAGRQKIDEVKSQRDAVVSQGTPLLITTATKPRVVRVLPRGNWLVDTGEIVQPGVPAFLKEISTGDRRATRLDLAQWLVAPGNPLVARVYVNRLWKIMFGRGIVSTLEDFGSQGAPPSNPALLDYLAADFVQSGWDNKRLLKMIAMSAAYRQSSHADEPALHNDPMNDQLARQGRYRLDAELIRDNALAVSGLLVNKLGGPSAKPYQPAGYYAHLNFPRREYQQDKGEGLYRRGLYTHWQRTFVHPSLLAFDAPSREECTVARPRSNTPLAALVLLNDPTFVEAARVLAAKSLRDGGVTVPDRVRYVFRQVLQRAASPEETAVLNKLYEKHLAEYKADPKGAAEAVSAGEAPQLAGVPQPELAAWMSVVRAVLNLHETITRN